jgi:hypothetical protein
VNDSTMTDSARQTADASEPKVLDAQEAARLLEFARACKAAARAVVLYPPAHPAIKATLGRIAQVTAAESLATTLRITVLPDGLLLDGRTAPRPDAALGELAALLHGHLIGELLIHPGGDIEAWRQFLLLLSRSPESVRAEGGVSRVWTTMAGRHVELREIDYAMVLRERASGGSAAWDEIVSNCLSGMAFVDLSDEAIQELMAITGNAERLGELMEAVDGGVEGGATTAAKAKALLQYGHRGRHALP